MTNQAKPSSLPPLRTRLQPFLDDIDSSDSAEEVDLAEWRAALKAAGPFQGTERWRAAANVVSNSPGKMPPADVRERTLREIEDRQAAKNSVRALAETHKDEAREYIRATRAATGLGPLWREQAARFGVTKPVDMRVFIWHLRKIGAVGFTQERGSLDLADPATAAAEAQWSSQTWAKVIREHMAVGSPFDFGHSRLGAR